ncbi:MAG: hypothetical protein NT062_25740, partial [Proteobacteria bacterium]|nr:hypothetical protein [Pseudomonadota bacterium]
MTTNRWKIPEYRRFLARHAQTLIVEEPTTSAAVIAGWLDTARAVLADESNIFDPAGDLVADTYTGPARNICRLHAWVRDATGAVVRRTYIREVGGQFDGGDLRPDDPTVFDWDAAFSPTITSLTLAATPTLEEMERVGLKNSAREQCLSAFARAALHHRERKTLQWRATDASAWSIDARLLIEHPLYRDLAPPLANALACAIDGGVFFRAAKSRRDGNYWFPGLNGGLPYVPKGDAIHEATYMFHDVMHQLMPDLVYDGVDARDHKRVYIAYRMMSEGASLVLADMLFARTLAEDPANAGYDFAKRRILPLWEAAGPRRDDLAWLLRQMIGFVVRGEPGELPVGTDAWARFSTKYTRFFVADFQWTRMNWQNLVARGAMLRHWIELVRRPTFAAQGVWFISDLVDEIGRDLPLDVLCERLFAIVWERRIAPALGHPRSPPEVAGARARSNGFRRWLTGQLALFPRYAPIVGMPPLAFELADRLRDPRGFDLAEVDAIRGRFADHVRAMAKDG